MVDIFHFDYKASLREAAGLAIQPGPTLARTPPCRRRGHDVGACSSFRRGTWMFLWRQARTARLHNQAPPIHIRCPPEVRLPADW
jgi:hypothetical protein